MDYFANALSATFSRHRLFHSVEPQMFTTILTFSLLCAFTTEPVLADDYFEAQPNAEPYYVTAGTVNTQLPCSVRSQYAQTPYYLNWIQNGQLGNRIVTTDNGNRFPNDYDLDRNCGTSGCYNLKIRSVTFERDNGTFSCQIQGNGIFQERVAQVVVLVEPGAPDITTQPNSPLVAGNMAEAVCASTGGNPPPTMEWFFSNGTAILTGVSTQMATNLRDPTKSTVRWLVTAKDNELSLTCKVKNKAMGDGAKPKEALSSLLRVHYAPEVEVGPVANYSVEKGSSVNLYCMATSNPPPMKWLWQQNSAIGPQQSWPQQNTTFTASKETAGTYTCTVTNQVGTSTASVKVDVYYGPVFSNQEKVVVREGEGTYLSCRVDANPPPIETRWSGPGGIVSNDKDLHLTNVTRDMAGDFTCTAKNVLTVYPGITMPRQGSKITTVVVQYPPGPAKILPMEPVVVGGTAKFVCKSDDPGSPEAKYRWRAPGQLDFDANARNEYIISNVQMTHAGEYACVPENEFGKGDIGRIRLMVLDPARLDKFLTDRSVIAQQERGLMLQCSGYGHPAPNITWFKDGLPIEGDHWRIVQQREPTQCEADDRCSYRVSGTLQWNGQVEWTDKGQYLCQAFNGAGTPSTSSMTLKVEHAPVIVNDPDQPYVAVEVGKPAWIECKVSSRPLPNFNRWFFDARDISADYSLYDYSNDSRNETFDVFSYTLNIRNVREEDFGQYQCRVGNRIGENNFTFTVQKKSKPHMPKEVKVLEKTHTAVVISWVPGFDGGYHQDFIVEVETPEGQTVVFNTRENPFGGNVRQKLAEQQDRYKRHVGIERPSPVAFNVSGLGFVQWYKFRVSATNVEGASASTVWLSESTLYPPIDPNVERPNMVEFNRNTKKLRFERRDQGHFCLLVYVNKTNGEWEPQGCEPASGEAWVKKSDVMAVKARYCDLRSQACSDFVEATLLGDEPINEAGSGGDKVPVLAVAIPIVVAVAVLFLIIVGVCFYRRRANKPKENQKKKLVVKDYEAETNQIRAPYTTKTISAPYMPSDRTMPAASGLETAGSKDSGVFTTNGSVFNYQFDGPYATMADNGYGTGTRRDSHDNGYTNGADALDDEGMRWQDLHHKQDNGGYDSYYGHEYPDMGGYPSATDLLHPHGHHNGNGNGYARHSYDMNAYPDPYGHGAGGDMVDMNPAGGGLNGSQDGGSLYSGHSTPSTHQRSGRVMREIIV